MLTQEEHKALIRVVERIRCFENRNRRNISARFLDLPSQVELPDYWASVDRPRSVNLVRQTLAEWRYQTPFQVYQDLCIIFRNGQSFFGRSTEAWRDSARMETAVDEMFELEAEKVSSLEPAKFLPSDQQNASTPNPEAPNEGTPDGPRKRQRNSHTPQRWSPGPGNAAQPSVVFGRETDALVHQLILAYKNGSQQTYMPPYPEPTIEDLEGGGDLPHASTEPPSAAMTPAGGSPVIPNEPPQTPHVVLPNPSTNVLATPVGRIGILSEDHLPEHSLPSFITAAPNVSTAAAADEVKVQEEEGSRAASVVSENSNQDVTMTGTSDAATGSALDTESGWLKPAQHIAQYSVYQTIFAELKKATDPETGRNLAEILLRHPSAAEFPRFYEKIAGPITFEDIEARLSAEAYKSAEDFDRDLHRIFADSKKWLPRTGKMSHLYGDVCALHRIYNTVTKNTGEDMNEPTKTSPLNVPKLTNAKSKTEDVKLADDEKDFLDSINYKGATYRHGDWLHMSNFAHPEKPIIGQVWKMFKRKDNGQRGLTMCWFLRPEETVHPVTQKFYEHEVAKTPVTRDHEVEDILERCCVMFITRYTRGRPKAPMWNPDMPTYVCENRYKASEKTFKRIKNWAACVPEEARVADQRMELDLFSAPLHLRKVKSPFAPVENTPVGTPANVLPSSNASANTPDISRNSLNHTSTLSTTFVPNRRTANIVYAATGGASTDPKPLSAIEIAASNDSFDVLPASVSNLFRCDPATGDMLWFANPPMASRPSRQPVHSFAYLSWLAKQPKERQQANEKPQPRVPAKRALVDDLRDYL